MQWWHYVLIGVGVLLIGWLKIATFKKIMKKKSSKSRFNDEE